MGWHGGDVARYWVQRMHIALRQGMWSRHAAFALVLFVHIFVPLAAFVLYVACPRVRVLVAVGLVFVIAVQVFTRTCPLAKLEWALVPEASTITWRGAESLEMVGLPATRRVRFWYMCLSTLFAVVVLYVVHWALPDGL